MPAGDADRIRDYATRLVEDARRVGEARIKFRAGDIREALQIRNYSSVCQALDGPSFHKQAGVELLAYSGVPSRAGANAYFEFEILASSNLQREGVPNDSLEETPLISNQDLNEDFDRPEIEDLPTTPFVNDGEAGITSSLLERILKLSPDEFENRIPGSKGIFGCRSHRQVLRRWDRRSLRHSFHKCEGGFSGETICDWKQRRN